MGARAWFAASAAVVLCGMSPIASWGAPPPPKAFDLCDTKVCEVIVVVLAKCEIYLVPEEMGVKEGNTKVKMLWTIHKDSTGKVVFTDDAVVFTTNGHEKELDGKLKESATKYKWDNKNELAGAQKKRKYKYGVKVVQNKVACPTHDPTIVNDY
jgi:hypothetical protein